METVKMFEIWEDGGDVMVIKAGNGSIALDIAAQELGYVDYAEMIVDREYGMMDGLNVVEIPQEDENEIFEGNEGMF